METDDDFKPPLGRMRAQGKGRKYLHRVLAAANLARGGGLMGLGRSRFTGSSIGRGAGVGRVLASRDRFAAFRRRRVIIKARIVGLAGKGVAGARAHLRYIQRDGTTREGAPGELYDAGSDCADGKAFLDRGQGDRHQFRFIVSPEDGADYEDLRPLTRRLMARMEEDLGTRLEWVAVDHFNTGHPHSHIIVRGRDERGRDLIIARDYINRGMRERAAELVDLDLGPRSDRAIEERVRAEVEQERLTSIDRALLRDRDGEGLVGSAGRNAFDQTIRIARLRKLERLGLAAPAERGQWRVSAELADTLKRMGERGDIVRTMQRAYAERGTLLPFVDLAVYDPTAPHRQPLVGRILERGLADELNDRHYLIIEATDGRSHYIEIGKPENFDGPTGGAIVRVKSVSIGAHEVDRTIAAVAAANEGRYSINAHLRHDPGATEAFAEAHNRRLEAMRRLARNLEREPDGSWIIPSDHLDRVVQYEAVRARDRPVAIELLSAQPLEKLIDADAATWLDRELIAADPEPLRDAGFGGEARDAQARRRQWLIAEGFAEKGEGGITYRPDMLDVLRRRELLQVVGQLADELGIPFAEAGAGQRIEGVVRRRLDLMSGRFAVVENSREFTLVPWRPVLERQIGKKVSGILRGDLISWTIGRDRGGPSIS